jgi:3-deoxy-D-manno-octulosonic-acid transferase
MINGYDIAWGTLLALGAPYWTLQPRTRRKVFRAMRERMARRLPPGGDGPAVLIHAVSLGEMNATRALVQTLAGARPDLRFVVTTTTDVGWEAAGKLYGSDPNVRVVRFPLDFSGAVSRLLDGLRPTVVALMELEVWPNFMLQCERRGIPVVLINGRLTESSFRNYRLGGPLVKRMFRRLSEVCAQDQTYAARFLELGAPAGHVRVTGTMKFDTAQVADRIDGDLELAAAVGLRPGEEPVWVCGSTGPGEEEIVLEVFKQLDPRLRLVLVPRKPERFDEVAELVRHEGFALVRRGTGETFPGRIDRPAVVLGDTMGELRKFYSVADVVFVGRTLVDLGQRQRGSDMIEPSALGKPVIVGPYTHNFADAMARLRDADAVRVVHDGAELGRAVAGVLASPDRGAAMGRRAQDVVRREQGATARNAGVILAHLARRPSGA